MTKKLILLVAAIASGLVMLVTIARAQPAPAYLSPRPGALMVMPGTTIAIRPGDTVDAESVTSALFRVTGTLSGLHAGQAFLADDLRTIIFKPDQALSLGETISVQLAAGLMSSSGQRLEGVSYSFETAKQLASPSSRAAAAVLARELPRSPMEPGVPASPANPRFLTLPQAFPAYTVTVPANNTASGDLFIAPFSVGLGLSPYALILSQAGELIYYRQLVTNTYVTDFKRQPDGSLTYFDGALEYFVALNNSYQVVNTYAAGNGYSTDLHELQILPNGHSLLMSYDPQPVDMSQVAPGGLPNATVVGLVVQELDVAKNVVFQWRSWDHFSITDTYESLTTPVIDYVHGNGIELDQDGNLLISSRHLSEVTKINRQTGNVIWRLGGKQNQFTFTNDSQKFAYQHDIRRLPNGHITLWDNRVNLQPLYSRASEYVLDEPGKHVSLAWEYRDSPDGFSLAMGSAQRLPNGNTLTNWGTRNSPELIEVKPDGSKAFELALQPFYFNYRAFRLPWHGYPTTTPTLVAQTGGVTTTLAYSWNGATEIGSYRVYGGDAPYPTDLIAIQPKTAFEDRTVLVNEHRYCYFRVMPVDNQGHDTTFSNEVYTRQACFNGKVFLPSIMQ
jgi:hypothetical protein